MLKLWQNKHRGTQSDTEYAATHESRNLTTIFATHLSQVEA